MPIADFVRHVGAMSRDRAGVQSLIDGLADAASLRAYASAHNIELSEAEALAVIQSTKSQSPAELQALTDDDLTSVNGGSLPEGMGRIFDIIKHSISPSLKP